MILTSWGKLRRFNQKIWWSHCKVNEWSFSDQTDHSYQLVTSTHHENCGNSCNIVTTTDRSLLLSVLESFINSCIFSEERLISLRGICHTFPIKSDEILVWKLFAILPVHQKISKTEGYIYILSFLKETWLIAEKETSDQSLFVFCWKFISTFQSRSPEYLVNSQLDIKQKSPEQ